MAGKKLQQVNDNVFNGSILMANDILYDYLSSLSKESATPHLSGSLDRVAKIIHDNIETSLPRNFFYYLFQHTDDPNQLFLFISQQYYEEYAPQKTHSWHISTPHKTLDSYFKSIPYLRISAEKNNQEDATALTFECHTPKLDEIACLGCLEIKPSDSQVLTYNELVPFLAKYAQILFGKSQNG